jgi:hypothetical protein
MEIIYYNGRLLKDITNYLFNIRGRLERYDCMETALTQRSAERILLF